MKKRFLSWLRFIKKQGSSAFFIEKIGRSFIYPSLKNSDQKIRKNFFFKIVGPHHTSTDIFWGKISGDFIYKNFY